PPHGRRILTSRLRSIGRRAAQFIAAWFMAFEGEAPPASASICCEYADLNPCSVSPFNSCVPLGNFIKGVFGAECVGPYCCPQENVGSPPPPVLINGTVTGPDLVTACVSAPAGCFYGDGQATYSYTAPYAGLYTVGVSGGLYTVSVTANGCSGQCLS